VILRRFCTIAFAIAATVAQAAASDGRSPAEETFLLAWEAFRAGDAERLTRLAPALRGHVLEPYLDYARLRLRIEQAEAREVNALLAREAGTGLAERLRADWLRELGRRGDWVRFQLEHAPLVHEDAEIRCYRLLGRLAQGEAQAALEAEALWLEARELPPGCHALAERLRAAGALDAEAVWRRLRRLLEAGQVAAARRSFVYLPAREVPDEALFALAAAQPQRLLAKPPANLAHRPTREMVLFAVARLARSDPRAAAAALAGDLGARLPQAERSRLWGVVATAAARRLLPEAIEAYRLAAGAPLEDEHLVWMVRAALRAGHWVLVRDAIDRLPPAARTDRAWHYWYGRALAAQGNAEGARAYYLRIAGEPDFYSLLAGEELGWPFVVPEPFHEPDEATLARVAQDRGLVRALALYRVGLRAEANREWNFALHRFDDPQLLAAAELARRAGIHDRAITSAARTVQRHNYRLRYPAPYGELLREQARAAGLEEAWVLGLVRQESAFLADARSSAGARGLMQLMPATAQWMARRIGLVDYTPKRIAELRTNTVLGTAYLRLVLDELGHPVLAAAAYNAGPERAQRWRDTRPLEGAIYAETIPFDETRDYVKKVMANAVVYAALEGAPSRPLKERLGTIPPRSPAERSGGG